MKWKYVQVKICQHFLGCLWVERTVNNNCVVIYVIFFFCFVFHCLLTATVLTGSLTAYKNRRETFQVWQVIYYFIFILASIILELSGIRDHSRLQVQWKALYSPLNEESYFSP